MMKKRNLSIDIVKCICAILVVFKHYNPLFDINESLWSYIYFFITSLAVPIFFVFSGYFTENNEKAHTKSTYINSIKRLLIPYTLWGIIYGTINFILRVVIHKTATIKQHIIERIVNYFLVGTSFQMWYIISLIICITIYYLIWKYKKDKLIYVITIIGLFVIIASKGNVLIKLEFNNSFLQMLEINGYLDIAKRTFFIGIPYFFLGNTIAKIIKEHKFKLGNRISIVSFVIYLIAALFIKPYTYLSQIMGYAIITIIALCACSQSTNEYDENKRTISIFPNLSYYSHPLCLIVLNSINKTFGLGLGSTVLFVITIATMCLESIIVAKLNNKYINMFAK